MVRSFRQKENLTLYFFLAPGAFYTSKVLLCFGSPRAGGKQIVDQKTTLSLPLSRILCQTLSQTHSLTLKRFSHPSFLLSRSSSKREQQQTDRLGERAKVLHH
jgi:hypothetical protein